MKGWKEGQRDEGRDGGMKDQSIPPSDVRVGAARMPGSPRPPRVRIGKGSTPWGAQLCLGDLERGDTGVPRPTQGTTLPHTPGGGFGGARAAGGWLWLPGVHHWGLQGRIQPWEGQGGPTHPSPIAGCRGGGLDPDPGVGVCGRVSLWQVPGGERVIPGDSGRFPAPSNLRLKSRSRVSMATGPTRRRCCGGPGGWAGAGGGGEGGRGLPAPARPLARLISISSASH